MEMPISRASAFQMRNRTTHSWYDGWMPSNDLMSRSCPPVRTLEDHIRSTRAKDSMAMSFHQRTSSSAPVVIRARNSGQGQLPSSSASSPGPTTAVKVPLENRGQGHLQAERPSSAYSYDGGFFVTANNASKDFFVINPEWVSENETVRKLSEGAEAKAAVTQSSAPPRVITWKSYQRSKSAPPGKYRNPITWRAKE